MPKETLSVTNNAFTKPAIIVDASGSPRKNPASSANLLNQFFSAQKYFCLIGLNCLSIGANTVSEGAGNGPHQRPAVLHSRASLIREELCKSKSIAITTSKAASDWRSGYVPLLKARSNAMKKI
jgi:hypothetical protein